LGRIAIFIGSWLLSRKDSFFWGTQNETAFFEVIEDIFFISGRNRYTVPLWDRPILYCSVVG
jgi:hypothetical protein